MTVAATALITLAEARVFPGLSAAPAADDAILEALIDGASLDFETYWENAGIQRSFTETYTYREILRQSPSRDTIWLRKYPIVSVTSITDPDTNTVAATDYWIDADVGALRMTGGWTIPQDTNGFPSYWTIVYTAGRVAATASVPANIKVACKMWVAELYKRPDRSVISKTIGNLSLGYQSDTAGEGLPPTIARMISAWKKRGI